MQQPYGKYPYYGPPIYPPQTPYAPPNGIPHSANPAYPPFYGPHNPPPPQAPQHPNPPAPAPYSFNADAYLTKHDSGTSSSQTKVHHRRTFTGTGLSARQPLKSAMKKTMDVFTSNTSSSNTNQLTRQKSNPPAPQAAHQPRQRVHSNPSTPYNRPLERDDTSDEEIIAWHMLVSFQGYNELRIENTRIRAIEELRQTVWPIWPPGVETDHFANNQYTVRFHQAPWDLNGPHAKYTYRLIAALFQLFQIRGYSFQAMVNNSQPVPRLVFQVTAPEPNVIVFLAYFSSDHRRFTLINPPSHIELTIGARLRSALPKKALSDTPGDDDVRVIELKKGPGLNVPEVDPMVFYIEVLNALLHLGFMLDTSVILSRRNALGIRVPRELLVFKTKRALTT